MSLFNACLARDKARRRRANEAQPFQIHELRKDGQPSRSSLARTGFATEAEALAHVAYVRKLNPSRTLRFTLNGQEV